MLATAEELRKTVETVMPMLRGMSDAGASVPRDAGKWSRKQVLGHLIDSACNNQQKFVRTMARSGLDFVGYEQNHWVDSQHYSTAAWDQLVSLWQAYNAHLAHIIEHVDPKQLSHTINVEDHGTFTLEFIMNDYIDHMKHHLLQILPEALEGKFQNNYIPE